MWTEFPDMANETIPWECPENLLTFYGF